MLGPEQVIGMKLSNLSLLVLGLIVIAAIAVIALGPAFTPGR